MPRNGFRRCRKPARSCWWPQRAVQPTTSFGSAARSAGRAVEAALAHPLLREARGASRVYRELPITLQYAPGRIFEGTIDLVSLANGAWTVVDFKTDPDITVRREQYERQVQWYRFIAMLAGRPQPRAFQSRHRTVMCAAEQKKSQRTACESEEHVPLRVPWVPL